MKKILTQYFWIFLVAVSILYLAIVFFPEKKNRLEFIEDEIKKVQEKKKVLTSKEKELEKLATEKDWEQVDKDTTK
jgi:hypothetical protein|tara:strand:+ start:124 stop:351 length:228 start_codon:yes stop_codon:yes gene_type:complete